MKRPAQGGFTLVELLIGLVLTALLFQGLFLLLSTSFLSWQTALARMETHQTARTATEAMTRVLRLARSIAWPPPGQSATLVRFTKRDSAGQLQTLIFQQGSPSGLNGQTLYRINTSGQPGPLTQNVVTSLSFQYQAPRLILVSMTVTDSRTKISDTVQTAVTCLNIPD